MVGRAKKGPINERTYITNQQQFVSMFGNPDSAFGFESYAALQYLRQGRQLWFVRTVGPDPEKAEAEFDYWDDGTDVTGEDLHTPTGAESTFSGTLLILANTVKPGSVTITCEIPTDEAVIIVDDGEGALAASAANVIDFPSHSVITGTINYTTGAWTLDFDTLLPEADPHILADYTPRTAPLAFTLYAVSEGEWANTTEGGLSASLAAGRDTDTFLLTIFENGIPVEKFDNLTFDGSSSDFIEDRVNDISEYVTADITVTTPPVSGELPVWVTETPFTGGDSDLTNMVAADVIGVAWDATLQQPTGLQLFASPNAIDINLLVAPGWYDAAVVNSLLQICTARADCMAIIDPPENLNPQEVVDWHNGQGVWAGQHAAFNSSYAALYWPWVKIYDSYNRQYVFTPPSGHALAVYAYNDRVGEAWYAPAGLNRGKVISGVDIEYDPTVGEQELMYGDGNAVNMIERFTKDGLVIWGQRTLQRIPTALDRVNVRRLLLYLRKVISTAVRALVFEPNDEVTWRRFGHLTVPFLQEVTERRGLYDFRVKCDETTNTPTVIDRNELHAQIFLKPVKAAEFIQVDLVVTSTGANFDEVLY